MSDFNVIARREAAPPRLWATVDADTPGAAIAVAVDVLARSGELSDGEASGLVVGKHDYAVFNGLEICAVGTVVAASKKASALWSDWTDEAKSNMGGTTAREWLPLREFADVGRGRFEIRGNGIHVHELWFGATCLGQGSPATLKNLALKVAGVAGSSWQRRPRPTR